MSSVKAMVRKLCGPRFLARRALRRELAQGEQEIRLIPALADHQGVFLDVGANQGVYSLCAKPHFARVVSVEAHPGIARWLEQALRPGAEVIHTALSDSEGTARLHIPVQADQEILTRCSLNEDANPGFEVSAIDVPMTTIDRLAIENVSVIKIDIEGHELAALRGASETIARCQPVCIVECEERHNANGVALAMGLFAQWGYEAYFIHRGQLRHGSEFDPAVLQQEEGLATGSGTRSTDYVNNFIFVPGNDNQTLDRLRDAIARC